MNIINVIELQVKMSRNVSRCYVSNAQTKYATAFITI